MNDGGDAMSQDTFIRLAVGALVIVLASAILAVWFEHPGAAHFVQLTGMVLSWEVIASGVAVAAVKTFKGDISNVLNRLAAKP
jgi:hypothetical protein